MSWTISGFEAIAIHLDEEYFKTLIKLVKEGKEDAFLSKNDFSSLKETIEQYNFEEKDFDELAREMIEQGWGFEYVEYEENYAQTCSIDKDGKILFAQERYFEGYFQSFAWMSKNLYEPIFKNKEEMLERAKTAVPALIKNEYWSIEDHVIFVEGVYQG